MMPQSFNIGIAGLGTVGAGVFQLLQRNRARFQARTGKTLQVVAVSARDRTKDRGIDASSCRWSDDARELSNDAELDLVVETIGGDEGIAREVCEGALHAGKHLVTANKALISTHGMALVAQAEQAGCALMFEAAVAGGIPILKSLREGLAGNCITRVAGVLNGTSNFILTQMEQHGAAFSPTLEEAQALGYAEADPAFDINGTDVAHKLRIMAALAFGCRLDFPHMPIEGIEAITPQDMAFAAEMGCVIRLLGIAEQEEGRVRLRVQPCLLPANSSLNVDGVTNAVLTEGDAVGRVILAGPGAGAEPTASSVVADIIDIARGYRAPPFSVPVDALKPLSEADSSTLSSQYFLRCEVTDAESAIAQITAALDEQGITVASSLQHAGETQHIAITTQEAPQATMDKALATVEALKSVTRPPQLIRMETI